MQLPHRPVVLVILDGVGIAPPVQGNPFGAAKLPTWNMLVDTYPTFSLQASSEAVGLPWGEMGNSEVGHLNLGAGRIIYQNLPRITRSIADGNFFTNKAFEEAAVHVQKNKTALHLFGLVSVGSIHANMDHLYALMEFCKKKKLQKVFLHLILDGRDSPRDSGLELVQQVENKIKELGIGKVATLSGRYYAMDRDSRWDRIEKAYNAIAAGVADRYADNTMSVIKKAYEDKNFDEEFLPTVIGTAARPTATVQDNDALIFFNFRPDRARQITTSFVLPGFEKFPRTSYLKNLFFVGMTEYDKDLPVIVAFPPEEVVDPIASVIADAGLRQLHIAETEKYAHITYFFNGGREEPFKQQDNIIIPSPSISSYDQKPEMSADELTERLIKEIKREYYDFIVVNYANPDMVGHTGNREATIKALEAVDGCLGKLINEVLEYDGILFITSDHGNAEELTSVQTGSMNKEHSVNPVPFIAVGRGWEGERPNALMIVDHDLSMLQPSGVLSDVAPTILAHMGLKLSESMTGNNLLIV